MKDSALICVFALFASGCPGNGGDATAEIGTGTTAFESLSAEQDLELIAGPQGGFHFIIHASMSGIRAGDPTMPGLLSNPKTTFFIFDDTGQRIDAEFPAYRLGYRERTDTSELLQLPSGRILPLADTVLPTTVYDKRVRLRVEIAEDGGPSASDEVFVVAREGDPPAQADAGPDASAQ